MDIITKLNWVDILVVIIMLRTTYVAFQDGLSHEILPTIGAFSGLLISLAYYKKIGLNISENIGGMPASISSWVSFVAIFFAVILIFKVVRFVFDKIIKVTWHPFIEKIGGLLAGAVKAAIITSAILIMLALLPLSYLRWSIMERSLTGAYFLKAGPYICAKVLMNTEDVVRDIAVSNTGQAKAKK